MDDNQADPQLLELLRKKLGGKVAGERQVFSDTAVLADAEYIYDNALDVSIDMRCTRAAAASVYDSMRSRGFSAPSWSEHTLHPKLSDGFTGVDIVNFVFTMDLLNFSFWSELNEEERFQVDYRGKRWKGYDSLVACLRRALDEGVPITTPRFWRSQASKDLIKNVFRSATIEEMPMIEERCWILTEVADVLRELEQRFEDPEHAGQRKDPEDAFPPRHFKSIIHDMHLLNLESPLIKSTRVSVQWLHGPPTPAQIASATEWDPHVIVIPERLFEDSAAAGAPGPDMEDIHEESETPTPVPPPNESVIVEPTLIDLKPEPDLSVVRLVESAENSAAKLVNMLAERFSCFRDEAQFCDRNVRFLKRAQIFVADLWAALDGESYGKFHDIDHLTMFPDYRVPQMLHTLGVLTYSPSLEHHIRDKLPIASGDKRELELRGCSIWAVELLRREIKVAHPDANLNAVLIDFHLYDLAKEKERQEAAMIPHHRTRSIWY